MILRSPEEQAAALADLRAFQGAVRAAFLARTPAAAAACWQGAAALRDRAMLAERALSADGWGKGGARAA